MEENEFPDTEPGDYLNYLNCISYIDNFLRQLLRGFEKQGLLNSTIFLILGDHGETFGDHGTKERASNLYEEALHIPMLIYAPALYPNGGEISGVRQQIDILPTVADMLAIQLRVETFLEYHYLNLHLPIENYSLAVT